MSCVLGGCTYERVVYNRPLFGGLPGVQTQQQVTPHRGGAVETSLTPAGELRVEDESGEVRLRIGSIRDLMYQIAWVLEENEAEIFVEQLLSDVTRREFAERGIDPVEGFNELKRHEADVRGFFERVPQGEFTPGVFRQKVGDRTFRLSASGPGRRGYRFIDVVQQREGWRLRWFGY